jgi:beta-lactam-binding protein with PASTA domain
VAEGHCEVPRDVTSEILERAGFQAGGSESVAERNGREKGRVIKRMGKEGESQNQSR